MQLTIFTLIIQTRTSRFRHWFKMSIIMSRLRPRRESSDVLALIKAIFGRSDYPLLVTFFKTAENNLNN